MKKQKGFRIFLLLLLTLTAFAVSAVGEGEYRTLHEGSYGNDVLALKERLYSLGYFSNNKFNNRFTEDTAARMRSFLSACGLPENTAVNSSVQRLLFSADAISQAAGKNGSGTGIVLPDADSSAYRQIGPDSSGDDVLELKKALEKNGFFTSKAETGEYNTALSDAIKAYQRTLSLTEDGIASPLLQEMLYGKRTSLPESAPAASALPASAASPSPAPTAAAQAGASKYVFTPTQVPEKQITPTSTPTGPSAAVSLPALNAQGFLADPDAPAFVHADRDAGHWYYISQNLSIEIVRLQNKRQNITWFETDIRCTAESLPQAFLAQGSREPGHNYLTPHKIADQYNVILGISDDFYGYRWYNRNQGLKQGVIIRNGEIKANEPLPADTRKWPYLEILALFNDGSMRTYESDEYTAQEYLDMGVIDTFAFGPILVHDGIIDAGLYDKTVLRYTDDEPRMALGCVEPYHYIIVTAKGRTSDSNGVTMHWLAERMKALGCDNALNLDGGGTVALYFMGDVLNKAKGSTNLRDISSMFGFAEN